MIKHYAQRILKQMGLYHRIQTSIAYDLYWWVANKTIISARTQEVKFYRNLLKDFRRGATIFDVGANLGSKTDIFLRLGARVVAIEPDEFNQEVLRRRFLKHRVIGKPVIVVGKAVGETKAVRTMWIDVPGSAMNTLSPKWVETLRHDKTRFGHCTQFDQHREVETITLEQLIDMYGAPYYIKIDVEGYEPKVLRGLNRPVPYVSFEVNLPEFRTEGQESIELLRQLDTNGKFNYASDCQNGLVLKRWIGSSEFRDRFDMCADSCIEVFWKTSSKCHDK